MIPSAYYTLKNIDPDCANIIDSLMSKTAAGSFLRTVRNLTRNTRRANRRNGGNSSASTRTPAAGAPASGTPAAGAPASGAPAAGAPASGTPVAGAPAAGAPAAGAPAAGAPSNYFNDFINNNKHIWEGMAPGAMYGGLGGAAIGFMDPETDKNPLTGQRSDPTIMQRLRGAVSGGIMGAGIGAGLGGTRGAYLNSLKAPATSSAAASTRTPAAGAPAAGAPATAGTANVSSYSRRRNANGRMVGRNNRNNRGTPAAGAPAAGAPASGTPAAGAPASGAPAAGAPASGTPVAGAPAAGAPAAGAPAAGAPAAPGAPANAGTANPNNFQVGPGNMATMSQLQNSIISQQLANPNITRNDIYNLYTRLLNAGVINEQTVLPKQMQDVVNTYKNRNFGQKIDHFFNIKSPDWAQFESEAQALSPEYRLFLTNLANARASGVYPTNAGNLFQPQSPAVATAQPRFTFNPTELEPVSTPVRNSAPVTTPVQQQVPVTTPVQQQVQAPITRMPQYPSDTPEQISQDIAAAGNILGNLNAPPMVVTGSYNPFRKLAYFDVEKLLTDSNIIEMEQDKTGSFRSIDYQINKLAKTASFWDEL